MKQKKIGTTLYVFSEDPYVITEDTDAKIIYIQEEVIFDFAKINIPLISKMKPINYRPVCVTHPEWAEYYNHNFELDYLTIESLADDNTISWSCNNASYTQDIQYSTDMTNWTSVTSSTSGTTMTVLNTGDKLYLKGTLTSHNSYDYYDYFTSTGKFKIYGNIMSLTNGDDFASAKSMSNRYQLYKLFYNSKVTDASDLILPATTLAEHCYSSMFSYCTSLVTAPELPATTLADYCYINMFTGCTSLVTAPELPATTLTQGCYANMFNGCISLTTAPVLPATTLVKNCYENMFVGCTSLVTAPELPATTLAYGCYGAMFSSCTSLTSAPELPATILAEHCYTYMFQECTSLNSITMLATDISATECLSSWVSGVAATGTFTKAASMESLPTGVSGIPEGWTVQDA